jgi:ADP-dependent NAD(P)H-hydrate dehydratase / NAD(P)H-hydrate epimerase
MKIFQTEQIKKIDEYTIKNEPILSVDLMERAAFQLLKWYTDKFNRSKRIIIFAGPGNNGGDGLALARLLADNRYEAEVHYVHFTDKTSTDWEVNRLRLENYDNVPFSVLSKIDQFPFICSDDIVIDAIFGSGLSMPVEGLPAEVIRQINKSDCTVISIDIPSGLFGEDNGRNISDNIIQADHTLCFQFPKLSFMFVENSSYVGNWEVLPIGLHPGAITGTNTLFSLLENGDISAILKSRKKFDHKGHYGHGLVVAGSKGKMGAAILAAKAALRTGIGLITCHIPAYGISIIPTSLPEAMVQADLSEGLITEIGSTDHFTAVAVGPGIGTDQKTQKAIYDHLVNCKIPMVIDADGINILGINKEWLSLLPGDTILTPHPKEFERIAGKSPDNYSRLIRQKEFSKEHNCIVVYKGAHTTISTPDGKAYFNNTGNPGMATAGSGDVLTGIILSLLSQGYCPENAAIAGVYIHGLAGDIAAEDSAYESIIASDITDNIGKAFNRIRMTEY